jgi:hypothetical protein
MILPLLKRIYHFCLICTGNYFQNFKARCMKIYNLYAVALASIFSIAAVAQTKTSQSKTASQTNSSANQAKAPAPSLSAQTDSLKMAVKDIKTSFNSLFGSKRDTIVIMISNIDYDDVNLATLKDNLKKLKGVKSVMMQYKSASALLEVSFKGKATDLWDKLPVEAKASFKLLEAGDNNITLENKNAKAANQ